MEPFLSHKSAVVLNLATTFSESECVLVAESDFGVLYIKGHTGGRTKPCT